MGMQSNASVVENPREAQLQETELIFLLHLVTILIKMNFDFHTWVDDKRVRALLLPR